MTPRALIATLAVALIGAATPPALTQVLPLVSLTNVWRYHQSGADLSGQFQAVAFDDSAWPTGRALFFLESAALPAPRHTALLLSNEGMPVVTHYFRTHFDFPSDPAGFFLTGSNLVDDGAVIYLNGVEMRRLHLPLGPITAATRATVAIGDATRYEIAQFAGDHLQQGDNVLAVEVHQATNHGNDVVFGLSLTARLGGGPDLIIWAPAANPNISSRTFAAGSCDVQEGCAVVGNRRLLLFQTETRNIGLNDLIIGPPAGNPLFQYFPCHDHFHFSRYADYRLVDRTGSLAVLGLKVGFCLRDSGRWNPSADIRSLYDCDFQGIQSGWRDNYGPNLSCQWVDITSVPSGHYLLELEVNPDRLLPEANYSNNITRLAMPLTGTVPCAGSPPANNDFASALLLSGRSASAADVHDCANKQDGEPNHGGNTGGHSLWYRWTAPVVGPVTVTTDGSSFDTVLAVYTGNALNALTLIASDNDNGDGSASRLTFVASAGTTYQIAVDGLNGAVGASLLAINPAANDLFANPQILSGIRGSATGTSLAATTEDGEPDHAGNPGGRSLWYAWTATNSGAMIFDTAASGMDTLLAVYAGNQVTSLMPVAAAQMHVGRQFFSRVRFEAEVGITYHIAVAGANDDSGFVQLNWYSAVPPRFQTPVWLTTNTLRLALSGAIDQRYNERSADLMTWTFWQRVTNDLGTVELTAPVAPGGQTFYRALLAE